MKEENKYLYGIQILRIIACIMVMIHHMQDPFGIILSLNTLGRFSVTVFFCISGFIAGYLAKEINSYTFKDSVEFYKKKITKFYPLYIFMFLFALMIEICSCIIKSNYAKLFNSMFIFKTFAFLSLTQSWIPLRDIYTAFNPLCWFMSSIMFCYFCQPWLLYKLSRNSSKTNILLLILIGGVLLVLTILTKNNLDINSWLMYYCPAIRLLDFIIAMIAGLIMKKYLYIFDNLETKIVSILEIIAIILCFLQLYTKIDIIWQRNILFIPVVIFTIAILAINKGILAKISNNKFVLHFAGLTSTMFLTHQIIYSYIHSINKYLFHIEDKSILIISSLIVVITFSEIMNIIINLLNKKLKKNII